MIFGRLLCWTLICLIFSAIGGSGQTSAPPLQCVQTFLITQDDVIYIEPGVVNCFSCALENVAWLVEEDGDLVPPTLSPNAEAVGTFLVIAMPDNYVTPGTAGRREIFCTSLTDGQNNYEVRLSSPILDLQSPILSDVTVNEGEMLKLQCASSNIPNLITFHILGPNGMPVSVGFFYSVPNVTRAHAGTYTCVVMGTLDNTTVTLNATSTVVVQYTPEVIASNTSTHNAVLGEELQLHCGSVGVPAPSTVWFHNDLLLGDRIDDNIIISNYLGDGIISILLIRSVESTNGGIYTCRANNTLGTDQESYTVRVVVALDQANTAAIVSCQCTTAIVFAGVLSILLVLVLVIFTTVILIVFIRRKKQAETETDVYYDTVNVSYHSTPTSVIETEINVAYGHINKST